MVIERCQIEYLKIKNLSYQEKNQPSGIIKEFLDFVRNSERGVAPCRSQAEDSD